MLRSRANASDRWRCHSTHINRHGAPDLVLVFLPPL
jgi:hypothetical protein